MATTKKATAKPVALIDIITPNQRFIRRLEKLPPQERAKECEHFHRQLLDLQAQVARARCSSVRQLRAEGHTLAAVAEMIGVSITRVKQIESNGDA
jgi:DNA-directed RNA polymerase sigma subunit (sigma70/sigma32)